MSEISTLHVSKRFITWSVTPIALFLISIGMRVPDPAQLHQPKPRPRAVIETAGKTISKAGHDASAKSLFAVEFRENLPTLHPPKSFRSRFLRDTWSFRSTTPPQRGARAPPLFDC